jgi:hypothetical protein
VLKPTSPLDPHLYLSYAFLRFTSANLASVALEYGTRSRYDRRILPFVLLYRTYLFGWMVRLAFFPFPTTLHLLPMRTMAHAYLSYQCPQQRLDEFRFQIPQIDSTVLIYAFLPTRPHLWRHRSVCYGEAVHGALEGGTCHRRNLWDIRLLAGLLRCLCDGDEFMTLLCFLKGQFSRLRLLRYKIRSSTFDSLKATSVSSSLQLFAFKCYAMVTPSLRC